MNNVQLTAIIIYVLITCYFGINWLRFSRRKLYSSPEETFLALIIFLITTLLWPFAIPVYCWQIIKTKVLQDVPNIPAKYSQYEGKNYPLASPKASKSSHL